MAQRAAAAATAPTGDHVSRPQGVAATKIVWLPFRSHVGGREGLAEAAAWAAPAPRLTPLSVGPATQDAGRVGGLPSTSGASVAASVTSAVSPNSGSGDCPAPGRLCQEAEGAERSEASPCAHGSPGRPCASKPLSDPVTRRSSPAEAADSSPGGTGTGPRPPRCRGRVCTRVETGLVGWQDGWGRAAEWAARGTRPRVCPLHGAGGRAPRWHARAPQAPDAAAVVTAAPGGLWPLLPPGFRSSTRSSGVRAELGPCAPSPPEGPPCLSHPRCPTATGASWTPASAWRLERRLRGAAHDRPGPAGRTRRARGLCLCWRPRGSARVWARVQRLGRGGWVAGQGRGVSLF